MIRIPALILLLVLPLPARPLETVEVVLKGTPAKKIKGELVRQNLKGITIKAEPDPGLIRWTQVESVNGKPTAEYVAALKQSMKDKLCPDCYGGLVTVLCPQCTGLGRLYGGAKACEKCQGKGFVGEACKAKGCDKGKIDCPGNCLKTSVGIWYDSPNLGSCRWFWWREKGEEKGICWSKKHIGDLMEFKEVKPWPLRHCKKCLRQGKSPCPECLKMGTFVEAAPRNVGTCPQCVDSPLGRGTSICPSCLGVGGPACSACCGGKQTINTATTDPCPACLKGVQFCQTCNGTGMVVNVVGNTTRYYDALRKLLPKLCDSWPEVTERLTFRDGHSIEGNPLVREASFTLFALAPTDKGDLQVLAIISKNPYRREILKAEPPKKEPEPKPDAPKKDPAPKSAPGNDVIVLKDGKELKGKILMRSDSLIMIETADGRIKVEMDKVAEVRPAKK